MKTRDLQTITLNIRNQQFPKINIYYSTKGIPSEYNRAEEKKKKKEKQKNPKQQKYKQK